MSSAPSSKLSDKELREFREVGKKAHSVGDFDQAIINQIRVVNHFASQGKPNPDESKLLCLYLYGKKDYMAAVQILEQLLQHYPDDVDNYENLGVILRKLNRTDDAVSHLEKAAEMAPDRPNIHDALAHSYGQIKEFDKCRKHGRISLEIKSKEALKKGIQHPIPNEDPKPFSYQGNNIIAFSLWGQNPRYLNGAIRNAQLIPDMYPGWRCCVYHDNSVPKEVIDRLDKLGSKRVEMGAPQNFYDGLFWRFLPATEKDVDRFLIRDIDSVVNVKERVGVDEWLESDKYFHIMRDYYSHTELILAGMWGGVGGVLPSLDQLLKEFKPTVKPTETYDQLFLRLAVWPTISQSLLSHDSRFDALDAVPFPKYGKLPPNKHIGQNEAALTRKK